MRILIVGDTYGTNYSKNAWPAYVDEYFETTALNLCEPSSSINYTYEKLTNELKKRCDYDVIIVALTGADRLYHKDMFIHSAHPRNYDGDPISSKVLDAIDNFYKHLYDDRNTEITWDLSFRGFVQLSLDFPNIKFILLPCAHSPIKVLNGNCVISSTRLLQYSLIDSKSHRLAMQGKPTDRVNHLTINQNKNLAKYVISFIENYKFGQVTYEQLADLKQL